MKKSSKFILLISLCLISIGIVLSVTGFFAGAWPKQIVENGLWDFTFHSSKDYDSDFQESGVYRVAADDIKTLSVSWESGNVIIKPYDGKEILIKETCREKLSEKTALRYRIKDGRLEVYDAADVAAVSFSADEFPVEKNLVIKVPKQTANNMDRIFAETSAANVDIRKIKAQSLFVNTSEGNFTGKSLTAESMEMSSVTGSMQADFLRCPENFSFDSSSGSCVIGLPKDSSASVDYYSSYGKIYNHFAGKEKTYTGEGRLKLGTAGLCRLTLETSDGNIRICQGSCFE